MNPKEFIEVTEANLLTHLGKELHTFFTDQEEIYTSWDEAQKDAGDLKTLYQKTGDTFQPLPFNLQGLLYFKRRQVNPASAIQPVAQCNMVANVTFHLMAQQIAIVLHSMKNLDKDKVLATSYDNIRKLTEKYLEEIQNVEVDAERCEDQPGNPDGSLSN